MLKTTTCTDVHNTCTISSVTKVSSSNLQIKRKYMYILSHNNPDTVTKWKFVVCGEESVLLELE